MDSFEEEMLRREEKARTAGLPATVRVVVMVMYVDGTSQMIDIKDPEFCLVEWNKVDFDPEFNFEGARIPRPDTYLDVSVKTKIAKHRGALVSTYPVPVG